MRTHTTPNEIAREFRWLALHDAPDEPEYLTPLRLQKLLYLAQGWMLAEHAVPIFTEPIEAWKHGPVVRSVFETFRALGNRPIIEDPPARRPTLTPREREVVAAVWEAYKRFSALALSDMTHDDPAYIAAYQPDADGKCRAEIPRHEIARSFSAQFAAMQRRIRERRERLVDRAARNTQATAGRRAI